jgi:hypothetical protein
MPAIIILGGHRTGTSITARLVQELGFPAAPSPERLLQPQAGRECDNPDGYFEDVDFVRLHRRMLGENVRSVGGWTNPRRDDAEISRLRSRYRFLVRDRNLHSGDWSLKDPRLCLLGDVLLESLLDEGIDARIITTTRPESQVVASLVRRRIASADAERIAATFEAGRQAVLYLARGIPCLELSLASAKSNADVEHQIQRLQQFLDRPDAARSRRLADLVRYAR